MKSMYAFLFLFCALCFGTIIMQAVEIPGSMSYQAIIRNGNQGLVTNSMVSVRVSILKGSEFGEAMFVERHQQKTNSNGLLTFNIGTGQVINGNFASIKWGDTSYYLRTETDPNGGTEYGITTISPMLSVPYALHAINAGYADSVRSEIDPIYSSSIAATITEDDTNNWNNKLDIENDPIFKGSAAKKVTDSMLNSWSSALHVELDSIFLQSPAAMITDSMMHRWDSVITVETDPLFTAWDKDYQTLNNKPVIDGSETKLNAGIGIIISGNGTTASPYVISDSSTYVSYTYGSGGNTYTIPNGTGTLFLTSNNDPTTDEVTLPIQAQNGQTLHIVHNRASGTDNIKINSQTFTGKRFMYTFAGGNWYLMSEIN